MGSIGCDFWSPDPPFAHNGMGSSTLHGPCYAVFLANAWGRPAQITVERDGISYDVTQFGRIPRGIVPNVSYDPMPADGIPAGEVAVLFLSHEPGVSNVESLDLRGFDNAVELYQRLLEAYPDYRRNDTVL